MGIINGEYEVNEDFKVRVIEMEPDEDSYNDEETRRMIVDIEVDMMSDNISFMDLRKMGQRLIDISRLIEIDYDKYGKRMD